MPSPLLVCCSSECVTRVKDALLPLLVKRSFYKQPRSTIHSSHHFTLHIFTLLVLLPTSNPHTFSCSIVGTLSSVGDTWENLSPQSVRITEERKLAAIFSSLIIKVIFTISIKVTGNKNCLCFRRSWRLQSVIEGVYCCVKI